MAGKPQTRAQRREARLRKRRVNQIIRRTALCVLTALVFCACTLVATAAVVFKGPSPSASDLLVTSCLETSALKFVPKLFFSAGEIDAIRARNGVIETDELTDTSMVSIPAADESEAQDGEEQPDIEIINLVGATYRGFLALVKDPSRVFVGTSSDELSADKPGRYVKEIAERYDAVLAINGGAFYDPNGQGNGGTPLGLVVARGKLLSRSDTNVPTAVGFTKENKLVVGRMTSDKAKELGIRDALAFGPALVVNGEAVEVAGAGGGLNPRTAIGQRADGTVLMLVIDGRQVNSIGASMADLVKIMMEYGAVNAGNLDGGASSMMYYNGEYVNVGAGVTGARRLPTAFVVK